MMRNLLRYTIGLVPVITAFTALSVLLLTGCQKTQTASAEQQASAARYGDSSLDPEMNLAADGTAGAPGEAGDAAAAGSATSSSTAASSSGSRGFNRFGFGGNRSEGPVKPLRRDTQVYSASNDGSSEEASPPKPPVENRPPAVEKPVEKREMVQAPPAPRKEIEKKIEAPAPPPAPPAPPVDDKLVKLGFAESIPGDNLHVRLPGEYASLGPISVERVDASGNALGLPWSRGTQMQIRNPNVPGGKIYFKVP